MEIEVWNGDWGLPTGECNCLQMMSLLKFSGVRFETHKTNNPFRSPNGHLPAFKHNGKTFTKFDDVLAYVNKQNYCPDLTLNANQLAESLAYRKMIEEKLSPALRYTWWMDSKNYNELTRPWYSQALPFPLNFYYPSHYKKECEDIIHGLYQDKEEIEFVNEIYSEAEKCLACLSRRLDDNDFFYGSQPTSLDAVVYGCLASLIKAPFKSTVLQNYAKASPNLVRFVTRVTHRYFPRDLSEYEKKQQKKTDSDSSSDSFPNKRRNQLLALSFALVASIAYGITNGIFSFSSSEVALENDYEIEDGDIADGPSEI